MATRIEPGNQEAKTLIKTCLKCHQHGKSIIPLLNIKDRGEGRYAYAFTGSTTVPPLG
jgi:hypothetical protein